MNQAAALSCHGDIAQLLFHVPNVVLLAILLRSPQQNRLVSMSSPLLLLISRLQSTVVDDILLAVHMFIAKIFIHLSCNTTTSSHDHLLT
jgi:hypothetical protein